MTTPHYSMAHHPSHLDVWARKMAKALITRFRGTDAYPVLCYRGLSGTTAATALMMALNRAKNGIHYTMMYVRKYDEKPNSHRLIETYDHIKADVAPLPTRPVFVVVDDFVCSGETVAELARGFAEAHKNHFRKQKFQLSDENLLCLTGCSLNFITKLEEYRFSRYMRPYEMSPRTPPQDISFFWKRERINEYLMWATAKGRKHCKRNSYKSWRKLLAKT